MTLEEQVFDVQRRFTHYPPDGIKIAQHQAVRDQHLKLAITVVTTVPDGREKALALTKLEESMFWANAAIARALQD